MSKEESKPEEYTLPHIEEHSGSYTNIYKNGLIWIGGIEKSIAIEIATKLNQLSELRKENEELHQSEILWFERNAELESQLSKAKELLIRVHEALTSQGMMSWVSKDYKEIESFLKS